SVSWNSASNEDAAEGDAAADPSSLTLGSDDITALLADPDTDPTTLPDWLLPPDPAASTVAIPTTTDPTTTTPTDPTTTTPTDPTTDSSSASTTPTTTTTPITTTP